jgi:hypothetical protein
LFTPIFAGQVITGSSASFTVTVNEQVAELLAASVTRKVFVVTPTRKVAPLANPAVCVVVATVQLSVPKGAVYGTVAEHVPTMLLTMVFAGQMIDGNCASVTVTVYEQVAVLPAVSDA